MKLSICGKEVDYKDSRLSKEKISSSCKKTEKLIEIIEKETGINPLHGLKDFEIFHDNSIPMKSYLKADLEDICARELRTFIVKNVNPGIAALYYANSIAITDEYFYPYRKKIIAHELGHNFQKFLPKSKKNKVRTLYHKKEKELIKRIQDGREPETEANKILTDYSFLHEYDLYLGDIVCFKGYVGRVLKVKKLKNKRPKKTTSLYSFHRNEDEFFADMFMMYFCYRKKLESRGLLDFAKGILIK